MATEADVQDVYDAIKSEEIDRLVMEALGEELLSFDWIKNIYSPSGCEFEFKPSTNWAHGGPIIEKYEIEMQRRSDSSDPMPYWEAKIYQINSLQHPFIANGYTMLIAAMRAFVMSRNIHLEHANSQ